MYKLTNNLNRTIALPAPMLGAVIMRPGVSITVTDDHFEELKLYAVTAEYFENDAVNAEKQSEKARK